jgi:gas vesicle protein
VHLANGNTISKMETEAINQAEKAQKMNPRIDDLRAEYLQLRGNPAQASKALEVGTRLKDALQEQSDLWQEANNGMENVKNRLETMMDEASSDQETSYTPTPMALEPQKPKRRK